ncbi:MAG TPA: hypothetical protein VGI27_04670, partial [Solirubrobacteraceae bacterium]
MATRTCRVTALAIAAALILGVTPALATTKFRPQVGHAMGLQPTVGAHVASDVAVGEPIPVVYHGGAVMSDVTVHTIFWAPSGYSEGASPGAGVLGYEALIQQFFTDVAHDSGHTTNIFSLLNQYKDATGEGGYDIS